MARNAIESKLKTHCDILLLIIFVKTGVNFCVTYFVNSRYLIISSDFFGNKRFICFST